MDSKQPLIVGFASDLMDTVRIEDAASELGFRVTWIESEEQVGPKGESGILLTDRLRQLCPDLLIFDLGNPNIPWRDWIAAIASDPDTKDIPLICYGPHVDVTASQSAKDAGARVVLARSRFLGSLAELLEKYIAKKN
jgi:CheY-like chemotaxis protein